MKTLEYPFTAAKIRDLRAGETVSLSGRIFTGRDRFHKYLFEGGKSPVDLKDGAIFHCGPVVVKQEGRWVVRAAGPTTSMRHEPYMAKIIEQSRLRIIIGKGGMGDATRRACEKYECIYLQAVGGAGTVLAGSVVEVVGVHFQREFGGADALWEMVVKDFRAIVAIDVRGNDLHRRVKSASKRALFRLFDKSPLNAR